MSHQSRSCPDSIQCNNILLMLLVFWAAAFLGGLLPTLCFWCEEKWVYWPLRSVVRIYFQFNLSWWDFLWVQQKGGLCWVSQRIIWGKISPKKNSDENSVKRESFEIFQSHSEGLVVIPIAIATMDVVYSTIKFLVALAPLSSSSHLLSSQLSKCFFLPTILFGKSSMCHALSFFIPFYSNA